MSTVRLYRAIVALQDAEAVLAAAVYTGNWTPPKAASHGSKLTEAVRDAKAELEAALIEAKHCMEADSPEKRQRAVRIAGERDVTAYLIASLLEQGYEIKIHDDEGISGRYSRNYKDLLENMSNLDMVDFWIRKEGTKDNPHWVCLVYGNSPEEVICNYTLSAGPALMPTHRYIKNYYDPTYILPNEEN